MKKPKKIVIVDDDKLFVSSLASMLLERGYEVSVAPNGKMGIELIEEKKPDLILLDVMMPEKNGMEVIEDLDSSKSDNLKKIIVMTSIGGSAYLEEALKYGVTSYIEKNESTPESISNVVENKLKDLESFNP